MVICCRHATASAEVPRCRRTRNTGAGLLRKVVFKCKTDLENLDEGRVLLAFRGTQSNTVNNWLKSSALKGVDVFKFFFCCWLFVFFPSHMHRVVVFLKIQIENTLDLV